MQQRSTLRRRGFLRRSTRIAAFLGALSLVIAGGILGGVGASTATADVPPVGVFGDFGSAEAEAYLYTTSGGVVTSSIPVDGFDVADSSFVFFYVPAGTYGIAFRDSQTGKWLPWLSHSDGSVPDATGGVSSCLLTVTVDAVDPVDVNFGSVALGSASTSTCAAPWGTASSFSGTIGNMLPAAAVTALLYYVEEVDGETVLMPVNRSPVGSNGAYSIDGVTLAGDYVVYLEIDDDSPFLDTWSDGSDAPDNSDPGSAPVSVAENTDYAAPAINLVQAAVLSGEVTDAHGHPIEDAEVEAFTAPGQAGDYYYVAATDSTGGYSLRVKPGVHYLLDVQANGYNEEFWPEASDDSDAIVVTASIPGQYPGSFDFQLEQSATDVSGLVAKFDSASETGEPFPNVTASLYKRTGSYWKKIATQSPVDVGSDGDDEYEFDFSEENVPALNSGDFRLRFHSPDGWAPISLYLAADSSNADPQIVDGPVCFIPILNLTPGAQYFAAAVVDAQDTKTKCGDEPQPGGTRPSGATNTHLASTGTAPPTATSTPNSTATPTATPIPAPTDVAAPSSSPAPVVASSTTGLPSWLWWALGALVVVIAGIIVWLVVLRPRP
jgi:hypothetical protein